jgi:hypothetical protein
MTEDQLQALARECGAQLYQDSAVYFREINLLQAFALRIEAQAIKSEQQGKQPTVNSSLNCTLRFINGELVTVTT